MVNQTEEKTVVRRVLELGKVDYNQKGRRNCPVTLEVELRYGPNTTAPYLDIDLKPCPEVVAFSMRGSIWNPRRTDIYAGGQNCDEIAALFPENKTVQRLVEIWSRWHLNDMTAGSRAQEDYLRAHPVKAEYPTSHYEVACDVLRAAGLNPNKGYSYGSAWLVDRLPSEIEAEIKILTAGAANETPATCKQCGGSGWRATARSASGRELERHERNGTPCDVCNRRVMR